MIRFIFSFSATSRIFSNISFFYLWTFYIHIHIHRRIHHTLSISPHHSLIHLLHILLHVVVLLIKLLTININLLSSFLHTKDRSSKSSHWHDWIHLSSSSLCNFDLLMFNTTVNYSLYFKSSSCYCFFSSLY